jgi:putative nucleotidyltransferase with HDIG domain
MTKTISQRIREAIQATPQPSASAMRLLHLMSDDEHELSDIIDIVKLDTGLTSYVLRVVNSPAFGLLKPINTVDRAVVFLGERMVVGIAMMNLAPFIFEKHLEGYNGEGRDLWHHDLRTAIAAREVAINTNYSISPDLAFTAGLLHDIGKSISSDFLKAHSQELTVKFEEEGIEDFLVAERSVLGMDHAQIGFELAENWDLPGSLQMAIRYHHQPAESPKAYRPLVYMVHLGDSMAMMGGTGTGMDSLHYHLDHQYSRYFDFSPELVSLLMLNVEEEYHKIEEVMLQE